MGNFNRGERLGGGGKRFGGDRGFGGGRDRDRGERPTMHRAICAECGNSCEVPFKPTGDKPVFCSNCFGKKEGGNNNHFDRRDSGRDSGRPSFGDKKMFEAVCDKCHKTCEVPFRPTGDKPVFCSDCFGKGEKGGSNTAPVNSDQYKKQFEMLNTKLDNILRMISPKTVSEKMVKEDKPVVKEAPKAVVKKAVAPKKVAAPKKVVKKKKKK
ncbi:hypothetical protein COT98_03255 [Candidatus Falkowbacteria bacterium CG10_big_fil_rev_8_21_14_0_10_39_9]|uniref:CxxC-x17-CxxC domain-containing protein n=1 Tax=Candidatus Falkowbacteria bacterium CG10_big_fil_rev_8_21_14_0_10_39_9 TaxID=1974566 RepID=A0A2M6WNY5_9BACT|nr:MAG: hypothetical protein COT98_03255 [Candidatus Falkowbacteria bacterium CG10_big_fil_rev_8_21_14_0_10_39_9]